LFKFLEKRKVSLVYIPLIIYWIMLLIGTSLPVDRLPSFHMSDKIIHSLAYFGLSILVYMTLLYQRKSKLFFDKSTLITILICLIYGIIDELHQLVIPGRFADTFDWFADSSGTLVGVLVINFLIKQFKYQPEFK
jgi:VanZ family protein